MKRVLCIAGLLCALASAPAFGQGCAMCWSSADAAANRGKRALNNGITLMLVPTLGLMAGFAGLTVVYSRKQKDGEDDDAE